MISACRSYRAVVVAQYEREVDAVNALSNGAGPVGRPRGRAARRRSPPAREPAPAPALADRCGLNRSTAWRILATLEHHGLVERDPATNRYPLGFGVVAAGGRRRATSRSSRRAHPLLRAARRRRPARPPTSPSPRRLELVYVDQVQAPPRDGAELARATPSPLHATSTGKAFLAALPDDELDAALARPLERFTDDDDHRPARALRAELDAVRAPRLRGLARRARAGAVGRLGARCSTRRPARPPWSACGARRRASRERLDALGALAAGAAGALAARLS